MYEFILPLGAHGGQLHADITARLPRLGPVLLFSVHQEARGMVLAGPGRAPGTNGCTQAAGGTGCLGYYLMLKKTSTKANELKLKKLQDRSNNEFQLTYIRILEHLSDLS